MVSCAACSRSASTNTEGITFHRFPKNPKLKELWIRFVNKEDWQPKNGSSLCSRHFASQCFDRSSQLKVRLFPNSIPTIEVCRLKYEGTKNMVNTFPVTESTPECEIGYREVTSSASSQRTSLLKNPPAPEDSPRTKDLKRKLLEARRMDVLNNSKIRTLQKTVCRQKKQILNLLTMTTELKERNATLEERNKNLERQLGEDSF